MDCGDQQEAARAALPAELTLICQQVPQFKFERNTDYAHRLHAKLPKLTLHQISLLCGIAEKNLIRDPAFHELPPELALIREQVPRLQHDKNTDYARRLYEQRPQLTFHEISLLSGVRLDALHRDPAFQELPAELALIHDQVPPLKGEENIPYARRLHMEFPELTVHQISLLSGARQAALKRDPAFQDLPPDLALVRKEIPQDNAENNRAYARRLHAKQPQLTLRQICLVSGVPESTLKNDPAFQKLPAELALIGQQLPRTQGERNRAYARRLHAKQPQLDPHQISLLSGVAENKLVCDPAFNKLPPELALISRRVRRGEKEKNLTYARRLRAECPQLALHQVCLLSGARKDELQRDPAFTELPPELALIRQQVAQRQGEKKQDYARRLYGERPQLTLHEISLLSGVRERDLEDHPAFCQLPAELVLIREQLPRRKDEVNIGYARRLHLAHPRLTWRELSLVSGVLEKNLKQDPAFAQVSASWASGEAANNALPESSAPRPRRRKRTATETAGAQPASQERQAARSVRPRLAKPRKRATGATAALHAGPAATPDLEHFAAELEGQLSDEPQAQSVETRGLDTDLLVQLDRLQAQLDADSQAPWLDADLLTRWADLQGQLVAELQAPVVATPEREQPQSAPQASQPELNWGARRARSARGGLADPGMPSEGDLDQFLGTPKHRQGARRR